VASQVVSLFDAESPRRIAHLSGTRAAGHARDHVDAYVRATLLAGATICGGRALHAGHANEVANHARAAALAPQGGYARLTVAVGGRTSLDLGNPAAVAPGLAIVKPVGAGLTRSIMLSQLTAAQYAQQLTGRGFAVVVSQGGRTLSTTLRRSSPARLPRTGTVNIGDTTYQAVTLNFSGFGSDPIHVTVLSNTSATGGSLATDRLVAALFILAFFVLAVCFTLLVSKALQAQLARFLEAARRLEKPRQLHRTTAR